MAAPSASVVRPTDGVLVVAPHEVEKNAVALIWHKGKPPYRCGAPNCSEAHVVYKHRKALMVHMKWHKTPAEDFFACDKCDATYPINTMLDKHKTDKHPTMQWPCSCGKVYKHRNSRAYHLKKKAGAAEPHAALPSTPAPQ